MDWSSVFEDEGEEDGNWVREEISSRTRIFGLFGKDGYTPLVCYAFTVNYILGVGCLGIPYAFLQSGMVLGSILVVALSMVSYLTVLWVAEATQQEITIAAYHLTKSTNPFIMSPFSSQVRRNHRVRNTGLPKHGAHSKSSVSDSQTTGNILMTSIKSVLSSATMESFGLLSSASTPTNPHGGVGGKVPNYSALSPVDGSTHQQHTMEEELHFASLPSSTRLTNHYHASHRNKSSASMAHSRMSSQENLNASTTNPPQQQQQQQLLQQQTLDRMTVQELEVTDLAEEFLGPMGKVLYQSALMALTYVGLLAYTQVFNDTFRLQLWPTVPAWIPPLLFGAIVVPLSCFDLQEQIAAQVAMSLLRFVSLGILVVGTLVALCVDYEHSALAMASSADGTLSQSPPQSLPLVRWQGFGIMFTTAIFSQLFQHSVPGLIRPLSKDNKKFIPSIFRAALITTASLYVVTGCVCVAYFGDRLSQSVNLDFVGFTWGLARDDGKETVTLMLVQALAMIVVLFPALDTLSVFPLIAITLGNNLHAACPQVTHCLFGHLSAVSSSEDSAPSSTTPPVGGGTPATHVVVHKNSPRKRYATVFWRLVAAIPPVLCSLEVRHLVVSLQIAGLCGILVALVFPALLHRHAQERSAMLPLSWTTTPSYTLYLSFSWSLWPWSTSTPLGSSAMSNGEGANTVEAVHPSQAGDSTVVVSGVLVVAAAALAISIYQML